MGFFSNLPSNPFAAMSEEEFLQTLERSRAHASQGMVRNADDVIADMRNKYGL
jgi:DNA-damage-inducible protein J